MRYHLNGFKPGDPAISPADDSATTDTVDVIIVGCGPAGLTLAAQLARIGGMSVRIFDQKDGPLQVGQADGIACRSMEMFEAFGFAHRVAHEAYHVNETVFWRPGPEGLARADRIRDVEDGLSHHPHVILNQARVHDFYLELMRNAPMRLQPDYGCTLVSVRRDDSQPHPIEAVFDGPDGPVTLRAKYIVGCDGARSTVRREMGHALKGEAARQLWGVMDVLAVTDFPDIRFKCALQSRDAGSVLIIPREGGYMVRLYVELDELHGDERASDRNVTAELLEAKVRAVFAPYSFELRDVAWFSAYEIGQRVCDVFDDAGETAPRMFIAGDACHTHSPKAGQGMNVSMADTFNLGWKLAMVLRGQAHPDLLRSYSQERQAKAQELIDFDRDMARLFSERGDTPEAAAEFQRYFQKHGRYTAGVETTYAASGLVADQGQELAPGLVLGRRFPSVAVTRVADGFEMELARALDADGRWRLLIFAPRGDFGAEGGPVARLCAELEGRAIADVEGPLDIRAVFQAAHGDLSVASMPALLRPARGRFGLCDYEKVFCAPKRHGADIFDLRQIDRDQGVLALIRPDQFVADLAEIEAVEVLLDRLSAL